MLEGEVLKRMRSALHAKIDPTDDVPMLALQQLMQVWTTEDDVFDGWCDTTYNAAWLW